jgi:hypothetical protein
MFPGLDVAPRVGEGSLSLEAGARPLGVQESVSAVAVELFANRGVVADIVFTGEGFGVDCRRGDGECGDSGRRNGLALGEPYESGEGLYDVAIVECKVSKQWRKSRWCWACGTRLVNYQGKRDIDYLSKVR